MSNNRIKLGLAFMLCIAVLMMVGLPKTFISTSQQMKKIEAVPELMPGSDEIIPVLTANTNIPLPQVKAAPASIFFGLVDVATKKDLIGTNSKNLETYLKTKDTYLGTTDLNSKTYKLYSNSGKYYILSDKDTLSVSNKKSDKPSSTLKDYKEFAVIPGAYSAAGEATLKKLLNNSPVPYKVSAAKAGTQVSAKVSPLWSFAKDTFLIVAAPKSTQSTNPKLQKIIVKNSATSVQAAFVLVSSETYNKAPEGYDDLPEIDVAPGDSADGSSINAQPAPAGDTADGTDALRPGANEYPGTEMVGACVGLACKAIKASDLKNQRTCLGSNDCNSGATEVIGVCENKKCVAKNRKKFEAEQKQTAITPENPAPFTCQSDKDCNQPEPSPEPDISPVTPESSPEESASPEPDISPVTPESSPSVSPSKKASPTPSPIKATPPSVAAATPIAANTNSPVIAAAAPAANTAPKAPAANPPVTTGSDTAAGTDALRPGANEYPGTEMVGACVGLACKAIKASDLKNQRTCLGSNDCNSGATEVIGVCENKKCVAKNRKKFEAEQKQTAITPENPAPFTCQSDKDCNQPEPSPEPDISPVTPESSPEESASPEPDISPVTPESSPSVSPSKKASPSPSPITATAPSR